MNKQFQLLPEWVSQEAVILAWPDKDTDWQPWLEPVRSTYLDIIGNLNQAGTGVVLLIRENEIEDCQKLLTKGARVLLLCADYNDTWVRDYAFLTCQSNDGMQPIEFSFNGWGNKFDARKDDQINQQALAKICRLTIQSCDLVVEGGALEIDQQGQLLSTSLCLLNPERNGEYSLADYKKQFARVLGAENVSVFHNGHLEGDDTDGHIDTLVRFTPDSGLVIQSAYNRPEDDHYEGLKALVEECRVAFPHHQIFELPLPNIVNEEGERLPASYANYLINNQQILCPIYGEKEDNQAIETLTSAFPEYKIVAINCLPLVQQKGSLHCITMQVPTGTLKPEIVNKLSQGVSVI